MIRGRGPARKSVSVFEGMTDFLSLLVLQKTDRLEGDAIVMHSLSSFQHSLNVIQKFDYLQVNTFLDNNASGKKFTKKFIAKLPIPVMALNQHFEPHVDLNDALKAGHDFIRSEGLNNRDQVAGHPDDNQLLSLD